MEFYGSVTNRINARRRSPEPEAGMGATVYMWSDRFAATVVSVRRFKNGRIKEVVLQRDKATRLDGNGLSESQRYEFARDTCGPSWLARPRKDGTWRTTSGSEVVFGERSEYRDYSF